MKIYKSVACFFIGLVMVISASAQKTSTSSADAAYTKGDYYDAVPLYKKAFNKEKNKAKKAEILFKTAESYRMVNDFKNQEVWYDKAIKGGYKEPVVFLRLAEALQFNGKYDEAIVQFTTFKNAAVNDPRGEDGIKACTQAQKWKDKPTRYRIDNASALNSKYSDFGVSYSNKDHRAVIFTSAREESIGKNNDGGTGEKFQDLYEASVDKKGKWSTPKPLLEPINSGGNDGGAALDKKGNEMFFTRCDFEKGKVGICEIYFTKRKGQTWDEPKLIPLSPDSATVGQPCLSPDEQTLYFVSDMPGGQGGKDIWMSAYDRKAKAWGKPVNLGNKVNTAEDDMFPFVAPDNTLYFASKGHPGMGGLDIFKTKMSTGGAWEEPVNMRYPINTPADDFAFLIDEGNDKGYLSSNREGGKGGDDIYTWVLPPLVFTVSGKVFDADSKANIEGVSIELFGSDGTSVPYKTDKTGAYKFDLKPETSYKVSATMKDYLNKYIEVSTVGLEISKDFIGDFDFAMKSTKKPIELPNILYDLAKWDLRPESKIALDGLVKTMDENPTIVIELGSHTDSRPIPMTNDTLSQRRAQSVVDYLIEKGVDADRLHAKGYGEKEPRTLNVNMGHFKAGDVLTDAFITGLKNTALKEEAHQLNRRTEFKVLRTNYVKGQKATENAPAPGTVIDSVAGKAVPKEDVANPVKVELTEKPKEEIPAPAAKEPGKIYVCEKKDTYMSVAKKFGMTMKDLKTLNGLKTEQIAEGMELKVEKTGDYTEFDSKFYTLEKGDESYSKIAKKINMKTGDLKKLNKGVDEDTFHPGKKIRIAK
ncbi:MAG: OmpA family protein [Bacteroidetes bacterium]|nr:OmpA family protein [Bacteroidota bacterium]